MYITVHIRNIFKTKSLGNKNPKTQSQWTIHDNSSSLSSIHLCTSYFPYTTFGPFATCLNVHRYHYYHFYKQVKKLPTALRPCNKVLYRLHVSFEEATLFGSTIRRKKLDSLRFIHHSFFVFGVKDAVTIMTFA